MPGIFSYAAATNPAIVTGGPAGGGGSGPGAPLPAAHAPANKLPLACEVGPVASRGESQEVWRMFS